MEYLKERSNHDKVNNIISKRLIFMMIREKMKLMYPVCDNEAILNLVHLIFNF